MKKYSIVHKYLITSTIFLFILFSFARVSAQITNPDLQAIAYNGKIAIQVKDALSVNTYFALNGGGNVDLSFYFGPDDPRNGDYIGIRYPQLNGKVYLSFSGITYQAADSLTFTATETLTNGTIKPYLFLKGNNIPEFGGLIDVCPSKIVCSASYIRLYFNLDDFIVGPGSDNEISIFAPGLAQNGVLTIGGYNSNENFYKVNSGDISPNCAPMLSGEIILIINGMTCIYQNGFYTSSTNCSPWTEYYDDESECGEYFENCTQQLFDVLNSIKFTLACRQWLDLNACNTTGLIKRPGKVAIGTTNFRESFNLTVKNGIITDKLKVTNAGWGDYVFEKGYPLMPLEKVESYVNQYRHLPNTPSAAKIEKEGGFELGETTVNHQVKIEEIFLHLIKLEEETKSLEAILFLHETLNKIKINK